MTAPLFSQLPVPLTRVFVLHVHTGKNKMFFFLSIKQKNRLETNLQIAKSNCPLGKIHLGKISFPSAPSKPVALTDPRCLRSTIILSDSVDLNG